MIEANYKYLIRPNFQLPELGATAGAAQRPIYTNNQPFKVAAGAGNLGGCKLFLISLALDKKN